MALFIATVVLISLLQKPTQGLPRATKEISYAAPPDLSPLSSVVPLRAVLDCNPYAFYESLIFSTHHL